MNKLKILVIFSALLYGAFVFFFVHQLSTLTGFFIGVESLQIFESSQLILQNVYSGPFEIWPYFLSIFLSINPVFYIISILLVGILLSYIVLIQLGLSQDQIFLTLFLFISSPIFIIETMRLSIAPLLFILTLLYIISYAREYKIASVFLLALLSFIDLFGFIIGLSILFLELILFFKFIQKKYFFSKLIVVCAFFVLQISFLIQTAQFNLYDIISISTLNERIVEFGAQTGFSVILLLFGFIGLFFFWKQYHIPLFIFITYTIILSFMFTQAVLYATFLLSILGSFVIHFLLKGKWNNVFFQQTSRAIFVILIVSSLLFYLQTFQEEYPNQTDFHIAKDIFEFKPEGIIFTSQENEYILNYLGLSTFKDLNEYTSGQNNQSDIRSFIYTNDDLQTTYDALIENQIEYIYIDPALRTRLTELYGRSGLLLLIQNERAFTRIVQKSGYELYTVNEGFRI